MTASIPLPTVDVPAGVLATTLPSFTAPVFLRLGRPGGLLVDRARTAFLRAASADLRRCAGGWDDGPGVLVERCAPDVREALAAEVHELAHGLRALGDEDVARSYLELMDPRVAEGDAATDTEQGG